MPLSQNLLGALTGLTSAIFLAAGIIFIRKATVDEDSKYGVFVSTLIGFLIYFPLSILIYYPEFQIDYISIIYFSSAGILALLLGRTSYYTGTKRIGASWSAPIKNASLLVSTLIGLFFLSEKATQGHLLGIILITIGVVILGYRIGSGGKKTGISRIFTLDLLFPIGAMLFIGMADPLIKVGLKDGTPILLGLGIMHLSALILISLVLSAQNKSLSYPLYSDRRIFYLGAGLSLATGLFLIFYSLDISGVVITIPLKATSPFFVMLFSYLFLPDLERINKLLIFGSLMIVGGAILIVTFM